MDIDAMNTTDLPAETSTLLSFTWLDYTLFCMMFGLSAVIGLYYGCFGNKQATRKDYLMAGKTMKTFPVAMSLMASNLSGISLLGIPSEMYMQGTQYALCMVSAAIMVFFVATIYLPVFYKLQLDSTYEYLKIRFCNKVRLIASVLYVIFSFLYIPIVIYVPALAFNQVTGINIYTITPIVSSVCIFYTTLGGLKAVVWTDTLQFSVTLLTLGFVLVMGTISVGGLSAIWETAAQGDRLEFFNMNLDPTIRSSFWGVVMGHIVTWMSNIGCNPPTVQRFLSVPTLSKAKRSLVLLSLGIIVTKAICCLTGLIMYAKYHDCDPLSAGNIKRADQILPYYVLDVANQIPGLSGLFVAGVFSTALSTLSTFLNSLAGIIYTDFMAPYMSPNTSEKKASDIMKINVVVLGFLCVLLVFVVEKLGATVLELSISFGGVTAGPLLGLFTLGMLVPTANEKGALWGGISSLLFMCWMVIKTQLHVYRGNIKGIHKPLYTYGCDANVNSTLLVTTTTSPIDSSCPDDEPMWLFRVSFYYYTIIGFIITMVVGYVVSWMTRRPDDAPVNPDLLSPCIHRFIQPSKGQYTAVNKELHFISITGKEKELESLEKDGKETLG